MAWRRWRDAALHYAGEVAGWVAGAALLVTLAAVAVVLLVLVVAGFTWACLREETAYLWRNLRGGGRTGTAGE